MTAIQLRRCEPSPGMRDLIPHAFWIAEPVDLSAKHAAGDTAEEAAANWRARFGEAEVRYAS